MRGRLLPIALILFALPACRGKSEDAKIHALFAKGASAAEDSDVHGVVDLLAENFHAGDLDRQSIKVFLAARLLRGEKVTVVRRDEAIKVEGDAATASFDAGLFSGERAHLKGAVPSRMGTYHFDLTLAKISGEWKVTKAEYREIPAAQFAIEASDF